MALILSPYLTSLRLVVLYYWCIMYGAACQGILQSFKYLETGIRSMLTEISESPAFCPWSLCSAQKIWDLRVVPTTTTTRYGEDAQREGSLFPNIQMYIQVWMQRSRQILKFYSIRDRTFHYRYLHTVHVYHIKHERWKKKNSRRQHYNLRFDEIL